MAVDRAAAREFGQASRPRPMPSLTRMMPEQTAGDGAPEKAEAAAVEENCRDDPC